MKKDITQFVDKCPSGQQVKVSHQPLRGLFQDISIPNKKCDYLNMNFIVSLPCTRKKHDSICIIIYIIKKFDHFIPMKVYYSTEDYSNFYLRNV